MLIVERGSSADCAIAWFYSLAELNAAIGELLKRLNEERPIRRLGVTRRQLLEESTVRRSSPCRPSPTCSPNGACAGSASIITSTPRSLLLACLTASRAAMSRCG